MSEYQYYEFCCMTAPLSQEARKEMSSLSSRAHITTHGASYVYHYGDFRGNIKKLLLKYFDVFFYMSNWGTVRLLFKYPPQSVNIEELKKYSIKNVISCEQQSQAILLDIHIHNEEGGEWIEGEGLLVDLLPLHEEIKNGNYQLLRLVSELNHEDTENREVLLSLNITKMKLSLAQKAFLNCIGID